MNDTPRVSVLGLGLWLPGFPDLAAWRAGERRADIEKAAGTALGGMHRRRAGPLGRALADVAREAAATCDVPLGEVATVIGSSIGEAATLVRLLDQMWGGTEPVSPADFTVSVHNAASGVLSIATANRGFTTSIAADHDTPAAALIEGIGLVLTEERAVLVACGDEGAPATLLGDDTAWALAAAAIVLAPAASRGAIAALELLRAEEQGDAALLVPAALDRGPSLNPQAGLVDLVDAIARGERGLVRLDRGRGRGYLARIAPAGP